MSAQVKKAGRIRTKIVATFLFVFLMMFNVQIGMHDGESGDISLFGLTLSLFTPSYAGTLTGTCCPQTGPICVVGELYFLGYYYLSEGPCS